MRAQAELLWHQVADPSIKRKEQKKKIFESRVRNVRVVIEPSNITDEATIMDMEYDVFSGKEWGQLDQLL